MTFSVKTIPDMLVEAYGNQTEVARRLKCSRGTVRKYVDDKDGKMHAIVNDVLMVHRGWSEREPGRVMTRPMCNDDDGMLISQVVDSVMYIDKKAFGILLSYYAHGSSKRAIASYYHATAKPRKMCGRGGEGWRKPSLATCRNEIDDILKASLFVLYQPMQNAFKMRKRVEKVKHVAVKSLDMQLAI